MENLKPEIVAMATPRKLHTAAIFTIGFNRSILCHFYSINFD